MRKTLPLEEVGASCYTEHTRNTTASEMKGDCICTNVVERKITGDNYKKAILLMVKHINNLDMLRRLYNLAQYLYSKEE